MKVNKMINYKDDFVEVISFAGISKNKKKEWMCICKCGVILKRTTGAIKNQQMKSCRKCPEIKYTAHGLSSHPLYSVWKDMKYRCLNKNVKAYKFYGDKGIKVHALWTNDAKLFIEWAIKNGWKEGLVIDRINSKGNYEPSNCRFITREENSKKVHKDNPGLQTNAKLTINEVKEIKKLLQQGMRQCDIARSFKTRSENINRISKNKRWKSVTIL